MRRSCRKAAAFLGRQGRWIVPPLGLILAVVAGAAEPAARSPIALPADPQAAVIVFDYEGGGGPPRRDPRPLLSIFADGRLLISDPYGAGEAAEMRLSSDELQALLQDLLAADSLGGCDMQRLRRDVSDASRRSALTAEIVGASTMTLTVRTASREYEARCPAVSLLADRFPLVEDLQRLKAIERRMTNVIAVARVGGTAEADRLAAAASRALAGTSPLATRLTGQDLSMVRTGLDGSRFCQFVQRLPGDGSGTPGDLIVSITESPDAPVQVSVSEAPTIR